MNASTVQLSFVVPLSSEEAFRTTVEELVTALARHEITFEPGPNGRVVQSGFEIGKVKSWKAPERIALTWRPASWSSEQAVEVEIFFSNFETGTKVTVEQRGWSKLIEQPEELAGWFAGELGGSFLRAAAPAGYGDWLTDRRARRPSGPQGRATYREPLYHYPNFRVLLEELALTPSDYLLEVGCGGGAFLKQALQSGCRAAAVDHSHEMVQVARESNSQAVAEGRVEIFYADAAALPFADCAFTCAVMTGVLGFLPDPVAAFREIRRVLKPQGRFVALGSDPEFRGTPAAPEPMASRLRFYEPPEFEALAREAGFTDARVVRRNLGAFARECGIPEQHLPLFTGHGAQFLLAKKV